VAERRAAVDAHERLAVAHELLAVAHELLQA
jgi:hypothetical protein